MACTSPSCLMSALNTTTLGVPHACSCILCSSSLANVWGRSTSTMLAPSRANAVAVAPPISPAAPVITTTLQENLCLPAARGSCPGTPYVCTAVNPCVGTVRTTSITFLLRLCHTYISKVPVTNSQGPWVARRLHRVAPAAGCLPTFLARNCRPRSSVQAPRTMDTIPRASILARRKRMLKLAFV